jgi:hypothetical protein
MKSRFILFNRAGVYYSEDAVADRLDRFMDVERGQFYLSHGGFVSGFTKYGEKFTRPALGIAPEDCHSLIKSKQ